MNKFSREEFLFLAKIAQQTERFNDMIEFIKHFLDQELNKEERSILSAAYKNVVGNKRAELRVLTAIEQKESRKQTDQYTLNYIRNYKHKIEGELKISCAEILNLIDSTLYPNAKQVDSKVFYLKMKGDYNRYLAEFLLDNEYHAAVEQATQAYKDADVLAKSNLSTTSPIRLGLHLNQSVFYYEILQNAAEAIRIANDAFEQAIAQVDSVNEENYKDCTLIMQLLRDNLTLWNNPEEEANDDQ
ncbi:unnamed protein product (macronuclear) [Paramecium tetraurelia]|uniref:14-3-3 domain-containing protein n=1 Tax=Paramecium tetraurelia TaxID=5888 RepID=A0EHJ8_PARTE|nr:uncharacterized protein GSPATT00027113001 [Paramecium tetraurelia]CAK94789.1 unnamed protein product [Paramecium tetraurelia]|eukprot:XP_001462162.1 hypothetical protein (macronuclear) [Paramecium tetraurelia strain d4-2]